MSERMVQSMSAGSVIVDVNTSQGGCSEASRPTSHSDPVYEKHGVIHYCVTNMAGAIRTPPPRRRPKSRCLT
ncbi:MAG TPA: hypothetical protein VLU73_18655 [Methylococcaceae bacterium]|nr:hypothetical protein [Methylococcaceae bacterium]